MGAEVDKLSGKLGLDTSDFKTAVREADRAIRVLESGFKASASALTDWTTDATGLEKRAESLTKKLDIQRLKVEALAAEHKRLAEENGANSRAAQEAEIKLNKETETLNKMELELKDTDASLQEMTQGEKEVMDATDDMGKEVEDSSSKMDKFQGVLSGVGKIAVGVVTAVAAIGAAAVAAAVGIGKIVFDAADAAGELVDLSTQTGISTTRLQELQYVGDQVGTSLDTITGSQAKLVRSMSDAQDQVKAYNDELAAGKSPDDLKLGDMAAGFKELGVSVTDSNGQLRDQQQVFEETIDALGKIENPAERDALAMQIFGKSAQELNPLIKAGSQELARLSQEAHDVGAVMSEENVSSLEAFGDTVASIKAGVKGLLGTLAAQFLPVFKTVAEGLQNLFKSETFKKRIQEISQAVQGFVKIVVDVMGKLFKGDVQGALATMFGADRAGQLVNFFKVISSFINDTLIPFVQTHAKEIKAALLGIGAALGAAGIVSVIAGIVAAFNPVTLIIGAIVAAVGLLSAAWAGNWGGIRDKVLEVWAVLQPALQAMWDWLSTNIPLALQTLSAFWTSTLLPAIQQVWGFLQTNLFPVLQTIGEFIGAVFIVYLQSLANTWRTVLLPAIQAVWSFLQTSVFPLLQAIGEFIGAVFNLAFRVLAGLWQNVLLPALRAVYDFLQANVFPIFRTVGDYIANTFRPILDGLASFINKTLVPAFNGIKGAIGGIIDFLKDMAERLNNLQLPDWLTPGSPTPWEIGLIGINDAMRELNKQLPAMASELNKVNAINSAPGLSGRAGVSSSVQTDSFQFFAPVTIQGETPVQSLGARIKGRRY